MFLDVAMLVENQAEMLDSIEHQAGNAVDYVDRATADVKKALEYQSAARKVTTSMFILFIYYSIHLIAIYMRCIVIHMFIHIF